jgi:WD40 repeat protein
MKKILQILILLTPLSIFGQKTELVIPTGHSGGMWTTHYSQNGKYVLTSDSKTVKIWDASGRLLKTLESDYDINDMAISSKSDMALVATSFEVKTLSLNTLSFEKSIPKVNKNDYFQRLIFDKNGTAFSIMGSGFLYKIVRLNPAMGSMTEVFSFKRPEDKQGIFHIALSIFESQLMIYMTTETIVVNLETGVEMPKLPFGKRIISFTPDGNLLAVTSATYQITFEWLNAKNFQPIWSQTVVYSRPNADPADNMKMVHFLELGKHFAWNPTNNNLIVATERQFFNLDSKSRTVTDLGYFNYRRNACLEVAKNGKHFIFGSNNDVDEFSLTANRLSQHFGGTFFSPLTLHSTQTPFLLSSSRNGNLNNFQFARSSFDTRTLMTKNGLLCTSGISSDGSLGVYHNDHTLYFFEAQKMTRIGQPVKIVGNSANSPELVFSANGKWLATSEGGLTNIVDVQNGRVVKTLNTGYYSVDAYDRFGAVSDDGKAFVGFTIRKTDGQNGRTVQCFDVNSGTVKWEKAMTACCFRFIKNSSQIFFTVNNEPKTMIVDAQTGAVISEKALPFARIDHVVVSNDLKKMAFVTSTDFLTIQVWDIDKNENIAKIPIVKAHFRGLIDLAFINDGNALVSVGKEDGTTHIWSVKTGKDLGQLITFEDKNEWVFITPDGRFDASAGALKTLYYVKGQEVIPLENLYEQYYTPQLIPRLLAGETFEPVPNIEDISAKPKVKINYQEGQRNLEVDDDLPTFKNATGVAEITVKATSAGSKIDEIRLFHNGKIVNLATRGLFVTDDATGNEIKKYTINLLAGQNTFRAVALNVQRTESNADEIVVIYQNSKQPVNPNTPPPLSITGGIIDLIDKNATLHLVVVGINKYQNPKMSLNYALADATSFKEAIEKDAKTVLTNVKTYFVTDATANKKGIEDALTEVKKNAKAQDVFVFYYAGHGVISDKNKEFYLVPTDVADLRNADAALIEKGIPSKLLQRYAVDIQAQKQVFILDACQSAGVFEQLMSADANQQKNLAVVARSTGTHWMAASGSQQFANEFATLGHGAFTYVLLQALTGQAAANKMITVNGLKNYMQTQVPELMKKYRGTPQYPASYGFGNDFPIGVVK